ncbi:response regulator [Rudanella paleaurantiibacter]|uniref:Response regulator n=1 Tax=Rudanella paleaurantiibacter TaxID=2614655 RepID=A0A7J5TYY2_9BACT|nr:response regulator transcription factor [Rudanella paleaurantiibacter]KAB7730352.1 response regulator [Rudanella paleaurantiibacter]
MNSEVILVVEDDFLNRRLTKKILLENGYHVLEAKNADEAMMTLQNESVDLVILDINLGDGEMDGIHLGKLIQAKQKTPFIYLTAYENARVISEAVATSPYSYLTKPFKNSDLVASVKLAIIKSAKEDRIKPTIAVKDGAYQVDLPLEAINYIESEGNYLLFHTDVKIFKSRSTISRILESLPATQFIQTHRAYIVNKEKIQKYRSKSVIIGNTEIPLSKKDLL